MGHHARTRQKSLVVSIDLLIRKWLGCLGYYQGYQISIRTQALAMFFQHGPSSARPSATTSFSKFSEGQFFGRLLVSTLMSARLAGCITAGTTSGASTSSISLFFFQRRIWIITCWGHWFTRLAGCITAGTTSGASTSSI
jgi:hypothetical protein